MQEGQSPMELHRKKQVISRPETRGNEEGGMSKRMRAGEESREMSVAVDEERMDMDQEEKGEMSDVESESSRSSSSSSSGDSSLS